MSEQELTEKLVEDLSECASSKVSLKLVDLATMQQRQFQGLSGESLDQIDPRALDPEPDKQRRRYRRVDGSNQYCSSLFRSLCPVTGQPDWADIHISIDGAELEMQGLHTYILGYRQHKGFHEECVEQIYRDIQEMVAPAKLEVFGRFLRRGGIDINPFRSSWRETTDKLSRCARQ